MKLGSRRLNLRTAASADRVKARAEAEEARGKAQPSLPPLPAVGARVRCQAGAYTRLLLSST
jgi:hypothetical protein